MMRLRTRVEPIDRDVELIFAQELSPQARSQKLAAFAREAINEAKETNRNVLGRVPPYKQYVDGSEGRSLDAVRPDGVIAVEFQLISETLIWIGNQLRAHSPVLTGRYQKSHTLYADGVEVSPVAVVPPADEYVFLSDLPYARKIERGLSKQAPDGVYQVVATLAARRFGNVAKIKFSYRSPFSSALRTGRAGNKSEGRVPAIVVTI